MTPEYIKLVMEEYEKKKKDPSFSTRLLEPTAAKLRQECIAKWGRENAVRDVRALREFLDVEVSDHDEILRKLRRSDAGDFRPLLNFLQGKTSSTDSKNIELLAWLIGFEGRPYVAGWVAPLRPVEPPVKHDEPEIPSGTRQNIPQWPAGPVVQAPGVSKKRVSFDRIFAGIGILCLAILGVYFFKESQSASAESCMYWAGDHYEPVSCNKKMKGVLVIALDSSKLYGFRQITQPDTLNYKHIGKIWYCSVKGVPEYFTAPGKHPVEINRNLRPLTAYIINKYIYSGE